MQFCQYLQFIFYFIFYIFSVDKFVNHIESSFLGNKIAQLYLTILMCTNVEAEMSVLVQWQPQLNARQSQ